MSSVREAISRPIGSNQKERKLVKYYSPTKNQVYSSLKKIEFMITTDYIKKLRELKNFTQAHMATQLDMSISGYAKIESNRTDVSLSKISKIADILETDISRILNFDAKTIFNQSNNTNCLITGNNETLNINGSLDQFLMELKNEINALKRKSA